MEFIYNKTKSELENLINAQTFVINHNCNHTCDFCKNYDKLEEIIKILLN